MWADEWRHGALVASVPLAVLAVSMGLGVAVTALLRSWTAGLGFFTEQTVTLTGLAVAGGVGASAYGFACRWVLRRIRAWQLADRRQPATAALAGLCLTALIVALPVLILIMLPQHPAP